MYSYKIDSEAGETRGKLPFFRDQGKRLNLPAGPQPTAGLAKLGIFVPDGKREIAS